MGKKSRSKRTGHNANVNEGLLRSSPNWPLLAISILGMALTAYLTYTSFIGASVKGCSAGSGCDVVLTSRWAEMFGLPTSLWGFLAYAGLAAISFIKRADKHWRYAWTAALLGVAYSVYLTTVSLTILHATCPYCLTSLSLMVASLAITTYQRPAELQNFKWKGWLIRRIPVAAVFVFALHLQYVVVPSMPDSPVAMALADHLTAIGAKFYGASWCEHCQRQKSYFGKAAGHLPYVECKAGGPSAPLSIQCSEAYISTFPTWIIKDRRIEGVLSLPELADMSGFKAPPAPTN
jgi:uncharacterized membrane protein